MVDLSIKSNLSQTPQTYRSGHVMGLSHVPPFDRNLVLTSRLLLDDCTYCQAFFRRTPVGGRGGERSILTPPIAGSKLFRSFPSLRNFSHIFASSTARKLIAWSVDILTAVPFFLYQVASSTCVDQSHSPTGALPSLQLPTLEAS